MTAAYLAQSQDHQRLEWLDGGTLAVLLDAQATDGRLMVGRFDVREGEAPPFHLHTREDEVFVLLSGAALVWVGDEPAAELSEGGVAFLPRGLAHGYRITSPTADLLMINTPAGIEGMFRHAGRDRSLPRPEGFRIDPELLAQAADLHGQVVVGPPR